MTQPLTYAPAYLGLFLSLLLAVACNAFLDIGYGSFGREMLIWSAAMAWTVRVGWRQQGQTSEYGTVRQTIVLIVGGIATVIFFIPIWGFPRAGLYMLLALQAALNCVTTTRSRYYMGLLVSLVVVIFAASHPRADWTLLFYLVPYLVAVVFALVSEQISRRAGEVRASSLGDIPSTGQGLAIAAATAMILVLGTTAYLLTPQWTRPTLASRFGVPTGVGTLGAAVPASPDGGTSAAGSAAGSGGGGSPDRGSEDGPDAAGWPSRAEMRQAATRRGMPGWQAATIEAMADLGDALAQALAPVRQTVHDLLDAARRALETHRAAIRQALLTLLGLLLLAALVLLLREVRAVQWLRTRFDFLWLALLGWHRPGVAGARQFYRAMERLARLHDAPRRGSDSPGEFLAALRVALLPARVEVSEFTRQFERCRYAASAPDAAQLARLRLLYGRIARQVG